MMSLACCRICIPMIWLRTRGHQTGPLHTTGKVRIGIVCPILSWVVVVLWGPPIPLNYIYALIYDFVISYIETTVTTLVFPSVCLIFPLFIELYLIWSHWLDHLKAVQVLSTRPAKTLCCISMLFSRHLPTSRKKCSTLSALLYCYVPWNCHDPTHCLSMSLYYSIKSSVTMFVVSIGWYKPSVTINSAILLNTCDMHYVWFVPDIFVNIHAFASLPRHSYWLSNTSLGFWYGVPPSRITGPSVFFCIIDRTQFLPFYNFAWLPLIYYPNESVSLTLIL